VQLSGASLGSRKANRAEIEIKIKEILEVGLRSLRALLESSHQILSDEREVGEVW
jgi:hypothetical protein